jgi:hypothetical protein
MHYFWKNNTMPAFPVKHHEEKDIDFAKYAWYIYGGWLLLGLAHLAFVNTDFLKLKIGTPAALLLANLIIVLTSRRSVKKNYTDYTSVIVQTSLS